MSSSPQSPQRPLSLSSSSSSSSLLLHQKEASCHGSNNSGALLGISKQGTVGVPVTAVAFVSEENTEEKKKNGTLLTTVLYGQGPYLHCVGWWGPRGGTPNADSKDESSQPCHSHKEGEEEEEAASRLLVWEHGGSIHGIRQLPPSHRVKVVEVVVAVFGGRQLALVALVDNHDDDTNTNKQRDNGRLESKCEMSNQDKKDPHNQSFVVRRTKTMRTFHHIAPAHPSSSSPTTNHTTTTPPPLDQNNCWVFDDWIWDCHFLNGGGTRISSSPQDNNHPHSIFSSAVVYYLAVGLAHNRVQVCSLSLTAAAAAAGDSCGTSSTMTTPSILMQVQHDHSGATRCLSYCMNLWCPPDTHNSHGHSHSHSHSTNTTVSPPPLVAVGTIANTILVWSFWGANGPPLSSSGSRSFESEDSVAPPPPRTTTNVPVPRRREHVLAGHLGVIHAVRFHTSGQWLASTSDDRTVRVWGQGPSEPNNSNNNSNNNYDCKRAVDPNDTVWTLRWTAWGHTARGWDVAFAAVAPPHRPNNTTNESECKEDILVLSTGEDGALRVWEMATGNALCVARGHACQCVWRVDAVLTTIGPGDITLGSSNVPRNNSVPRCCLAVTGGNDGTVALYNLSDRLPIVRDFQPEGGVETTQTPALDRWGTWRHTFTVPQDPPTSALVVDTTLHLDEVSLCDGQNETMTESANKLTTPQKKKARKGPKQVVVGMELVESITDGHYDVYPNLIVAMRSGSLWSLSTNSGMWASCEPWFRAGTSAQVESKNRSSDTGGCCIRVHPSRRLVAVGTTSGDVVLSIIQPRSALYLPTTTDTCPIVLSAKEYRSVQKLEWVQPDILLSFHVQSVVLWTFPKLATNSEKLFDNDASSYSSPSQLVSDHSKIALVSGAKGLAISYAINAAFSLLVTGDTRGNLVLFTVPHNEKANDRTLTATSTLRGAHRKEHVTSMVWNENGIILSVGNDAHIVKSKIDLNGELVKLLAVPVGSFTGLAYIWKLSQKIIVGGYFGNKFAAVDVASGYELFSLDTGGRQRMMEVFAVGTKVAVPSMVATCCVGHDGTNDVTMNGFGAQTLQKSLVDRWSTSLIMRRSTGIALHGESIFDVCLFPLDKTGKSIALLTASEDCTSKVTVLYDGEVFASAMLPPQVSGIRALCCCRLSANATLVVIGGKNEVQLLVVHDYEGHAKNGDIDVRFLGTGNPTEKSCVDQRINCVDVASSAVGGNENGFLVVSGDSNGSCYLYRFLISSSKAVSDGQLLYRDERPIVAMKLVKLSESYILIIGTTAGTVTIFDLPPDAEPNDWALHEMQPRLSYDAHSMGTNTISARLISSSSNTCLMRICTGGDDQAICCCDVSLTQTASSVEAVVLRTIWARQASFSALKGIVFLDDSHIATTGYDQQLKVWRCDDQILVAIACKFVDVGDINCLAIYSRSNGGHLIAVGGGGVELLSIDEIMPT